MTGRRIAVIDLGSNTFHLLISEKCDNQTWKEIHKEREYVKLASGELDIIDANAEQRAIDAMTRFVQLIRHYKVDQTRAIGTAALRESINGKEIVHKLSAITGIPIEIIDGQQEAEFILAGIRSCLPKLDKYGLIMDIGGGSVEFVLYKDEKVSYSGSFKIGVAILYKLFHRSDPIRQEEIDELESFLDAQLTPLIEVLKSFPAYYLIGASGSFEILNEVLPKRAKSDHWSELNITGSLENLNRVIYASLEERRQMPEIPVERLDYIVVAYLLIRFLKQAVPPEKVYYCDYALKEGVVAKMLGIK